MTVSAADIQAVLDSDEKLPNVTEEQARQLVQILGAEAEGDITSAGPART